MTLAGPPPDPLSGVRPGPAAGPSVPHPAARSGSPGPGAGPATSPVAAAAPALAPALAPDLAPPGVAARIAPADPADAGRGLARLDPALIAALGLAPGDALRVEAGGAPPACAPASLPACLHVRVLPARCGVPGVIRLDALGSADLGAGAGDMVQISRADLPAAITLRLAAPGPGLPPDRHMLAEALLDQPVTGAGRVAVAGRVLRVAALDPGPAARVTPATLIRLDPVPEAPWPGVAGLAREVAALREMVELPLRRPDLFDRLGLAPPRGVLFCGPPGSGKTLLARAVAARTEAAFFQIDGPEIVSKHYGESEASLRAVFTAAEKAAPAIIFIDEIDAIAPRRDGISAEKQVERRLVAQLLTLMDGLSGRGEVVVMAATNLPHALDPALRRPGRFDREIRFAPPDATARAEILALHLSRAPLAPDLMLADLAARTHGFVGADLAALAREAGLAALARVAVRAGGEAALVAGADPGPIEITRADAEAALAATGPSALRDFEIERPQTRWADVGGLAAARAALTEAVLWPLRHPGAFAALGLDPPRGLLLEGPPGTGKTLLARALAAEAGVNFIPVRGARLLSQYLGEAERGVADIFARARDAAPCILFFDEIDAIAPARDGADAALGRVVATLLTEIDGVEVRRGVFLLGATNRVGAIDPALLRPGRFDRVISLGLPDAAERAAILAVQTRAMPLDPAVDLAALAACTGGASGAELRALAQTAARQALARHLARADLADPAQPDPAQPDRRRDADPDPARLSVTPADIAAALVERAASARAARSAAGPAVRFRTDPAQPPPPT